MRVEITPYRQTKLLPLCKNCESWGHSKCYCRKEPRCVKCAGKHSTVQCRKPKEAQPKCYICREDHPSNYRGCNVAKKLQAIRNIAIKLTIKPASATRNEKLTTKPTTSNAQTYADKLRANVSQPRRRPTTSKTKNDKTFPPKVDYQTTAPANP